MAVVRRNGANVVADAALDAAQTALARESKRLNQSRPAVCTQLVHVLELEELEGDRLVTDAHLGRIGIAVAEAKAGDARAFFGQDRSKTLHFAGFSKEACEWLLNEREVAGLAVDTLSLDFGASKDFAVHKLWLGAGKWGLECVANLSKLPPVGTTIIVGAPKVVGASGGPTRVLAVWG